MNKELILNKIAVARNNVSYRLAQSSDLSVSDTCKQAAVNVDAMKELVPALAVSGGAVGGLSGLMSGGDNMVQQALKRMIIGAGLGGAAGVPLSMLYDEGNKPSTQIAGFIDKVKKHFNKGKTQTSNDEETDPKVIDEKAKKLDIQNRLSTTKAGRTGLMSTLDALVPSEIEKQQEFASVDGLSKQKGEKTRSDRLREDEQQRLLDRNGERVSVAKWNGERRINNARHEQEYKEMAVRALNRNQERAKRQKSEAKGEPQVITPTANTSRQEFDERSEQIALLDYLTGKKK